MSPARHIPLGTVFFSPTARTRKTLSPVDRRASNNNTYKTSYLFDLLSRIAAPEGNPPVNCRAAMRNRCVYCIPSIIVTHTTFLW
jgi:hypothetical protein